MAIEKQEEFRETQWISATAETMKWGLFLQDN